MIEHTMLYRYLQAALDNKGAEAIPWGRFIVLEEMMLVSFKDGKHFLMPDGVAWAEAAGLTKKT